MTAPTTQRKSLRELRESTGTLWVKNNTNKRITCNTEKVRFELDPAGGLQDKMIVEKECLGVPGFQRLWMRGAISITDEDDIENEIILQQGGVVDFRPKVYTTDKEGRPIEVEAELTASPQSRDLVFRDNSAPQPGDRNPDDKGIAKNYAISSTDGNGCVFCGKPTFIQQQFLDDGEPPLCGDHGHLKGQVASTPQPDGSWHHQPAQIQPVQKSNLPAGG